MSITRRQFLVFMGGAAGAVACSSITRKRAQALAFQPVKLPLPLDIGQVAIGAQAQTYSTYKVVDDLILPKGYRYSMIAAGETRWVTLALATTMILFP